MAKKYENEPLYLDENGLDQLNAEIARLQGELNKIGEKRKNALDCGARKGYEFAELDAIELQERLILGALRECYSKLKRVVMIEKHNEENIVDIGDIVTVNMMFTEEDSEELSVKLVAGKGNLDADIKEITINSPLGASIFRKGIGEVTNYTVNGTQYEILIKDITKGLSR